MEAHVLESVAKIRRSKRPPATDATPDALVRAATKGRPPGAARPLVSPEPLPLSEFRQLVRHAIYGGVREAYIKTGGANDRYIQFLDDESSASSGKDRMHKIPKSGMTSTSATFNALRFVVVHGSLPRLSG